MAINFDEFGFFDGVTRVDQVNWPKYMNATQPDGVVCSEEVVIKYGGAMHTFANSSGMKVFVHPGFCYVHSHYGISRSVRELPIQAAHGSLPRIDLVVARARYDAAPNSVLELDVVSGVPSAGPEAPEPRQEAGVIWEIPLARVRVNAGAVTIANSNVTDVRTCSKLPIEQGGTGATSKEGARANLGITPENIGALPVRPAIIEMNPPANSGHGGHIDFHHNSNPTCTTRIVETNPGALQILGIMYSDRHHPDPAAICFRQIMAGTGELIPGVTALSSGMIYLQYE